MIRFLQIQIFIAVVTLPLFALAQKPVITTSVDKGNILIGQQIELRVQVRMPDNLYRLSWFTQPDDLGSFVVARTDKIDSGYANGVLTFSQRLLVTSFDSGRQVIPPFEFNFDLLKEDSSFRMYTDSVPINVTYSQPDTVLPFHTIQTIIPVKKMDEWWFWPLVIGIALLLIILIIYLIRRKKKIIPVISENILSPFEEAMRSLDELKKQNPQEKGRFNIFFSDLTDIAKRYLTRIQHKNLMALTGTELIAAIKDKVSRENLTHLATCIRMGEAAKFAKYQPSQKDCADSLEAIRKLIETMDASIKIPEDGI